MKKRSWTLVLAGLSIVAAACVCTSALPGDLLDQGGDTAEDVEEREEQEAPEEAPAPEIALPVGVRDEVGGVSMNLPAGWESEAAFGLLFASADPAAMAEGADLDEITAPIIIGIFGPPDTLMEGEVTTVSQVTDEMLADFESDTEEAQLGTPEDLTVGGYPAQQVSMRGRDPDTQIDYEGALVTVLTDWQVGWLIVAAPADQWRDFRPTFDAIIASIQFFEPNPDAAFEDLGIPDTGGEIPAEVRSLAFDETKIETLPDDAAHDWTFEGTQGQTVGMSVAPVEDDFDVEMTLIGPDGAILLEVDDGFSGELEASSLTLPATGTYTLRVTGFAGFGGSYAVSISGS